MALNKMMLAALKTLSYPDLDVKKTYQLQRAWMGGRPRREPYQDWRVPYGEISIPVRIFFPHYEQRLRPPVILFFHGGGWVTGDINSYTRVCLRMARALGLLVISVDYRLAPEYRFPTAPEDCYHVARMLYCDGFPLRVRPEDIIIMGDSAGGNLAAVVAQMARDRGDFAVQRQILLYPATYHDHSPQSPFASVVENGTDYLLTSKRVEDYMELYQSTPEDRKNPYFAPLLQPDLSRQPDTLILTAEFDPLRDEGEEYGRRLQQAGNRVRVVRIPDALHGYFSLPAKYQPVKQTYQEIAEFLKEGVRG